MAVDDGGGQAERAEPDRSEQMPQRIVGEKPEHRIFLHPGEDGFLEAVQDILALVAGMEERPEEGTLVPGEDHDPDADI